MSEREFAGGKGNEPQKRCRQQQIRASCPEVPRDAKPGRQEPFRGPVSGVASPGVGLVTGNHGHGQRKSEGPEIPASREPSTSEATSPSPRGSQGRTASRFNSIHSACTLERRWYKEDRFSFLVTRKINFPSLFFQLRMGEGGGFCARSAFQPHPGLYLPDASSTHQV